jgi:hypothetical protein
MSAPRIDVLAVMDDVIKCRLVTYGDEHFGPMTAARAAIAELIESAMLVETTQAAMVKASYDELCKGVDCHRVACIRFKAALAAVSPPR